MNILICAATEMELMGYQSDHHFVDTMITGAGAPSTSFKLARRFSTHLPDLAIQIGIAGSFVDSIHIGDVVQVQEDAFADLGAQDRDGSFIHLSQLIRLDSPFGWLYLTPPLRHLIKGMQEVKAITVNKVHGFQPDIDSFLLSNHPDIETMEGAAFFASCMVFNIPCCQIRAVSNRVESRNRTAWDIPLALKNLNTTLNGFLSHLK